MADQYEFCWKADLKKAFHQVFRHPSQWHLNAMWVPYSSTSEEGSTWIDATAPMGFADSPRFFNLICFAFILSLVHFHPDVFGTHNRRRVANFFDDFFG